MNDLHKITLDFYPGTWLGEAEKTATQVSKDWPGVRVEFGFNDRKYEVIAHPAREAYHEVKLKDADADSD